MTEEEYVLALKSGKKVDFYRDKPGDSFPLINNKNTHTITIGICTNRYGFISNYTYNTADLKHSFIDANGFRVLGVIEDVLYYDSSEGTKALMPGSYVTGGAWYSSYDYEESPSYLEFK